MWKMICSNSKRRIPEGSPKNFCGIFCTIHLEIPKGISQTISLESFKVILLENSSTIPLKTLLKNIWEMIRQFFWKLLRLIFWELIHKFPCKFLGYIFIFEKSQAMFLCIFFNRWSGDGIFFDSYFSISLTIHLYIFWQQFFWKHFILEFIGQFLLEFLQLFLSIYSITWTSIY